MARPLPSLIVSWLTTFQDTALLADAAQQVRAHLEDGDCKTPSVITNPHVRRRERPGVGAKIAASAAARSVKQDEKPTISKPTPAPSKAKEEAKPAQPVAVAEKPASAAQSKKPGLALKRGASSNSGIMQAFSKAAAKPKKEKTSQPATPSDNDSSIQHMSDDGEDDAEPTLPKPRSTAGRKSKKEREDKLRRMMEEDDDDENEEEKAPTPEEEEEEEEEEPEEEPPAPEPKKEEPAEVVTASGDGRRRGRRRVMRKKQIMDEQGYLGMCTTPESCSYRMSLTMIQLPSRSPVGNPSRKTRPLPLLSQRLQA